LKLCFRRILPGCGFIPTARLGRFRVDQVGIGQFDLCRRIAVFRLHLEVPDIVEAWRQRPLSSGL